MDVTISIAPEVAPRIQRAAADRGQDLASFLEEFVKDAFTGDYSPRTLDEILAPFRAQVEASGISDEALDAFFEEMREKRFQGKQRKP